MRKYTIMLIILLCLFVKEGILIYGEEKQTYEVETQVFSEEKKPIEGAVFYLYKDGSLYADDIMSDAQGKIEIKNLLYGDYTLYQQSSSYGYEKIEHTIPFRIDEATKPKQLLKNIDNKRLYGNVSITLLNEKGTIVPNVWMSIQDEQGMVIKDLKSDDKGRVTVKQLPVGAYYIEQKDMDSTYYIKEKIEFDITPYICEKDLDMSIHLQKKESIHNVKDYSFAIGFVVVLIGGVIFGIYFFRRHSFTQFLDDFMI